MGSAVKPIGSSWSLLFLTLLFLVFLSVLWDPLHSSGKFLRGSSVAYTQENLTDRIWTLTSVCIYKHKFWSIIFIYYAHSSAACIFLTHVFSIKQKTFIDRSPVLVFIMFSIIILLLSTRPAQWPEAFCDYPSLQGGALSSPWIPKVTVPYWPDSYCLVTYVSESRM